MEPLQYDPRTKQQIKDALYVFLYTPLLLKFKTRLDIIIVRNALLGGYSHKSFSYKGVLYSCDSEAPPRKANRLIPQLKEQMDEYLAEINYLNQQEIPFVLGYINRVLNASNELGDYLRLLPPIVHRPVESLIATCPCQAKKLTDEQVAQFQEQSKESIELIKRRMVTNLLI